MARPIKEGLEYCSLDTNIFSDRKIRRLLKTFGAKGYTIFSCLLCEIFKDKGYYMQYDDGLAFDISDNIPGTTEQLVKDVINFCFECGLLDKTIFNAKGVLTSAGIQKRYQKAKEGLKIVIDEELWVIGRKPGVSAGKLGVSGSKTPQSKVKEIKENNSSIEEGFSEPDGKATIKSVDDLLADALGDQKFIEFVCMNLKTDPEKVVSALKDFTGYQKSVGISIRSVFEFRNHFQNRLRKQLTTGTPVKSETQTHYKKADARKYQ